MACARDRPRRLRGHRLAGGPRPTGRRAQWRGRPQRAGHADHGDAARDAAGQPAAVSSPPSTDHPEIGDEEVEGPLVIIGLPRTGTTALSNLLAADPQIRSVRLWESSDPVPPPEAAHQHDRPAHRRRRRRASTAMYETFPRDAVAALPVGHRTDRVPGPPRHGVPHRALRRHGPGPELRRVGDRLRHGPAPMPSTAGRSSSSSGTARRGCGI